MPEAISRDIRPRLAAKARLRYDRKSDRHMLLYPERGLVLNATGTDIVQLCTGEHTVGVIVEKLAAKYGRESSAVEPEVMAFLGALAERGLLQEVA